MDQDSRMLDQLQQVLIAQGQLSLQIANITSTLADVRQGIRDMYTKMDSLDDRITAAEAHIAEMRGEKAGYSKAVSILSTIIGVVLGVAGTVLSYVAFFQ
jgi:hypothetical protein